MLDVKLGNLGRYISYNIYVSDVSVRLTSPPATLPVLVTVNLIWTAGRCNQIAVEEPSAIGEGLPAAQFASRSADVLSECLIGETERPENLKEV